MGNTKYGDQPALRLLYEQGWKVSTLAAEIGVSYARLYNALRGRRSPSPRVREQVARVLKVKETDCFTPESLAAENLYGVGRVGL